MRCLNCDALIPVGLSGNARADRPNLLAEFCSEQCEAEFAGECDPELLATLQGLNPNTPPTMGAIAEAKNNFKAPSLLHFSVEQAIAGVTEQLRDVPSAEIADAVKKIQT